MATGLTKDARGFVDGVVTYLRDDGRGKAVVPRVAALMEKVSAAARKQKMASVVSAVPLSAKEKEAIVQMLAKFLGHQVELEETIDADIVGGFRISVGDWVVDTSLAGSLEAMGQSLQ